MNEGEQNQRSRRSFYALVALLALSTVLTVASAIDRGRREADRELMSIGLEDIARRLQTSEMNYRSLKELEDADILAKTKMFAELIAKSPDEIHDPDWLERIRGKLGVDEVHVSDEKGILIASIPAASHGLDMSKFAQTAEFMPALTNREFAYVQAMQVKPTDGKLMHYAGVARLDRPGIVQTGCLLERIEEAQRLANVSDIAASARIGRNGKVTIRSRSGLPINIKGIRIVRSESGEREYLLSTDYEGNRIEIRVPVVGSVLSDPLPFMALCVIDVLLALLIVAIMVPGITRHFLTSFRSIGVLVGGISGDLPKLERKTELSRWRRFLSHPATVTCMCTLCLAVMVSWLVANHSAETKARKLLQTNAADVKSDILESVDDMLFFIGNAICRHYRKPEAMTVDSVKEVMNRYDIDELNVVNGQGIIIAGALADVGFDMASNHNSAKFNRLLTGEVTTYCQPFRAAIENPDVVRKYAGVAFPDAKGYIQIGFDQNRLKNDIDYRLRKTAEGWHVGETGYFICAKESTGEILSCGSSKYRRGDTLAGIGFDIALIPDEADKVFEATLFGERCLCVADTYAFHRVVVAIPCSEIDGNRNGTIGITAVTLLLVFALVSFFMVRLTDLVESLRGFIAADKERRQQDMLMARTIQLSSLPLHFPDEADYRIQARMDAAREVGGDFYDFYSLPGGKIMFLVADVSGKGVPAAMFMMKAKAIVKACAFADPDLAKAVAEANTKLADFNEAEMFVTAWIATYDRATGEVEYVCAGHNPPLVRHADKSVSWIRGRNSLALAAMGGVKYHSEKLVVKPGESLFLYTDGVSEAMNSTGELYGEDRLEKALAAAGDDALNDVRADVDRFVGEAERSDDITVLVLSRKMEK